MLFDRSDYNPANKSSFQQIKASGYAAPKNYRTFFMKIPATEVSFLLPHSPPDSMRQDFLLVHRAEFAVYPTATHAFKDRLPW
jgi:hypothetical protein